MWRWWLAANAPEGGDADFSFPLFAGGVNADLSDNVGNLVNRLLKFSHRQFGSLVPLAGLPGPAEAELAARSAAILEECAGHFEAIRHRRACSSLRQLWSLGNAYVSEQAPWTVAKTDPNRAACIVRTALDHVALAASASASVIPQTAARILDAVGLPALHGTWPSVDGIRHGAGDRRLGEPGILFPRIDADRVQALQARFGGG